MSTLPPLESLSTFENLGNDWQAVERSIWRCNSPTEPRGNEDLPSEGTQARPAAAWSGDQIRFLPTETVPARHPDDTESGKEDPVPQSSVETPRRPVLAFKTEARADQEIVQDNSQTHIPPNILEHNQRQPVLGAHQEDENETCHCGVQRVSNGDCFFYWACNGIIYCGSYWLLLAPVCAS